MLDVLFVASIDERYYYDAFVSECNKVGLRVGILDPEHFIKTNAALHVELDSDIPHGYIELIELTDAGHVTRCAPIEAIQVAWYLRVKRTEHVRDIENAQRRFKWSETLCAIDALLATLDCQWVNTFEAVDRLTCNKLLQQQLAHAVDFSTPRTMMSNNSESVVAFSAENSNELLLKSIGYTTLDPAGELVLYSELFATPELARSKSAIRSCPVYAQECIPKRFEYRVMFIGGEVLACRIDSQASTQTRVDWRHYDFENVAHTAVELPQSTQRKICALMEVLGLKYGALDLIETPSGEYVFLEVNPNGQWGWIEQLAHLPIPETVACFLREMVTAN